MYLQKAISKISKKTLTKIAEYGSRSISQRYDLRIRIRTKISWIRNTELQADKYCSGSDPV
jgi:hypothetical protein